MKILSPVDNAREAISLLELGADDFYGGLLSERWQREYTFDASANRRSFPEAQIDSEEELVEILAAVHGRGGAFFLTLNSPFYTADQFSPLLDLTERALGLGVDALIASDIGLILEARRRWPAVPVHLSTMAEVTNSAAVAFYEKLGVRRITLPRHLTLKEVGTVIKASPQMAFDVFVLYGQCANAEGLCTFSHDHPRRIWPCVQPYHIESSAHENRERRGNAPALCGQMLWAGLPRGEACGLCGLWNLHRAGVEGLKIVGRGTATDRKEWAVKTVADLVSMIEREDVSEETFRLEARRRYGKRFAAGCRPTLCYFPELLEEGDG